MPFWLLNNKLVTDSLGRPINCPTCPCVGSVVAPAGCTQCDPGSEITTLKVQYTMDLNNSGTCSPNCAGWINTWTLTRLTKAQVDNLWATYPTTFPSYGNRDLNCWYSCGAGLPCSAQIFVAEVFQTSPILILILTMGWADNVFARLQMQWTGVNSNCKSMFASPGTANVGVSGPGGVPCDFTKASLVGNWPTIVITAT